MSRKFTVRSYNRNSGGVSTLYGGVHFPQFLVIYEIDGTLYQEIYVTPKDSCLKVWIESLGLTLDDVLYEPI